MKKRGEFKETDFEESGKPPVEVLMEKIENSEKLSCVLDRKYSIIYNVNNVNEDELVMLEQRETDAKHYLQTFQEFFYSG